MAANFCTIKNSNMTVEIKPQFILISDIINNHLVKEKYIGYSVKEAKKLFKTKYHIKWKTITVKSNCHWLKKL